MSPSLLSLSQLNSLATGELLATFANVIECWPQAAAAVFAADQRPFASIPAFLRLFSDYIDTLGSEDRLQILRLHPDLAGRAAQQGELTAESRAEQKQAGLGQLDSAQAEELQRLNGEYLDKFGFPFVICVRQTNRIEAILEGLRRRLGNSGEEELVAGIEEVRKICRLRLEALVEV